MNSVYTPKWKRILINYCSFLFKECPSENYHWFWGRYCVCGLNGHWEGWNGGVYDFKKDKEITYEKYKKEMED